MKRQLPQVKDISTTDSLLEPSDKIDSLIILDRHVDMITPLLTQLTYEGLVDEILGIKNCRCVLVVKHEALIHTRLAHVELPASLLSLAAESDPSNANNNPEGSANAAAKSYTRQDVKKKYRLDSSDAVLKEIRDLNFSHVGKRLNKTARRIDEEIKVLLVVSLINPSLSHVTGQSTGQDDSSA